MLKIVSLSNKRQKKVIDSYDSFAADRIICFIARASILLGNFSLSSTFFGGGSPLLRDISPRRSALADWSDVRRAD